MTTATRYLALAAAVFLAVATGCVGALETDQPPGDPTGDPDPDSSTEPDPDPTPDPDPQPTPLSAAEVQDAFNAAVIAALADPSPAGVDVTDSRQQTTLSGTVTAGSAEVRFQTLVLQKTPFRVLGAVDVTSRGQQARIAFAGETTGEVSVDGAPIGTIEADFPELPDFTDDAVLELLGLVLDCQGLDLGVLDGVIDIDASCTISDQDGNLLGSLDIQNVQIDLVDLGATGTILIDAAGTVTELILSGATAELIVDGEPVGTVDLGAIVGALL
jgi:hypothetical protein